jgi:NAD(P)-dependent dehydrogenase (short-subunit alcohol dehydrogenase family)
MISKALTDPLSLFDVRGQTALIAGASDSFGRVIALALASMGVNLVLASGSKQELDGVAEEARSLKGNVVAVNRRPDTQPDAQAMVDAALSNFRGLDMLVVASGYNKPGFIQDQSYEDWQSVMDANVRVSWLLCRVSGAYWLANERRGKVLLMSSVRGRHGNYSGYAGYCASKGAIDAMTRALATEWAARAITVNAVAPTLFRSKLTEWMYGDNEVGQKTRARSLSRIPIGRLGEVEDLIGMSIYLLSPASDFCTGQVMYVDGGYTAS